WPALPGSADRRRRSARIVRDRAQRGWRVARPRPARDPAPAGDFAAAGGVPGCQADIIEPALLLAPTHEAAQCRVAPIERTRRQVFLCGEAYGGCPMRQASDRLLAVLGDKRGEVLSIALTCSGSEARARQEALQCGVEVWQRWDDL